MPPVDVINPLLQSGAWPIALVVIMMSGIGTVSYLIIKTYLENQKAKTKAEIESEKARTAAAIESEREERAFTRQIAQTAIDNLNAALESQLKVALALDQINITLREHNEECQRRTQEIESDHEDLKTGQERIINRLSREDLGRG